VQDIGGDYRSVGTLIATVERTMAREKAAQVPRPALSKLRVGIPAVLLLLLLICGGGYFTLRVLTSTPTPTTTATPGTAPTFTDTPTAMPKLTATPQPPTSTPVPPSPAPTPIIIVVTAALATDTPIPPKPAPSSGVSPEQAVRDYYSAINNRQYEKTWALLSSHFKYRFNCCKPDGSYDFDSYVQWWDSVAQVSVGEVRIVAQDGSTTTVTADLWYSLKDGRMIHDTKPRIQLVWDETNHTWLFYDKGP
ncbi:MAG: hypothetical protein OEW09_10375, partial [Anaerolineae bacterium]|nr:hypothetical protein [Anaerolineae bacterium]